MTIALIYHPPYPKLALDYMIGAISGQKLRDEIVVFTDVPIIGVKTKYMPPCEKGFWNKLELFKHQDLGRTLYIDLDCMVTGPLEPFLELSGFAVGHDPHAYNGYRKEFNAGIMCFDPAYHHWIWDAFNLSKTVIQKDFNMDQFWLNSITIKDLNFWPDSWVRSYKWHGFGNEDTKLVHFHGKPKWWSINDA